MNINIIILSANNEIAIRNTQKQRETFVKHLYAHDRIHNYKVFFYEGGYSQLEEQELSKNVYNIKCTSKDDIVHTFDKTYEAYDYIIEHHPCDMIVRANISCYINVDLLDNILQEIYDREYIVANRVITVLNIGDYTNFLCPRGDFYVIRTELIKNALTHKDTLPKEENFAINPVDDTKMGVLLNYGDNKKYVNSLHCCKYGFVPFDNYSSVSSKVLNVRVKTLKNGAIYSGYSWEDIEYRRHDTDKMDKLYNAYNGIWDSYYKESVKLDDILVDDEKVEDIICVNAYLVNLKQIKGVFSKSKKDI